MRIGFPLNYFCGWAGGALLLSNLTNAIKNRPPDCLADIHILLLLRVEKSVADTSTTGFLKIPMTNCNSEGVLGMFLAESLYEDIYLYNDLERAVAGLRLDFIGPDHKDLGSNFPIRWLAYIPDFQHRYFPNYFPGQELNSRDQVFRRLVSNSYALFVNSRQVIADIRRFYSSAEINAHLYTLPLFLSKLKSPKGAPATLEKYSITDEFFIVCSQQWRHKRHDIVIQAFAAYLEKGGSGYLVFTGEMADYRWPNLRSEIQLLIDDLELKDRVRYLGLIPREDQLALLRSASALVQASEIEGGPGASGIAEAALLDTRVLLPATDPSVELPIGRFSPFKPGNIEELSSLMLVASEERGYSRRVVSHSEIDAINTASGVLFIRSLLR